MKAFNLTNILFICLYFPYLQLLFHSLAPNFQNYYHFYKDTLFHHLRLLPVLSLLCSILLSTPESANSQTTLHLALWIQKNKRKKTSDERCAV